MTKKIFRSIFAVALTVFLCSVVVIMGALYGYYSSNQMKLLGSQVELASQGVELAGVDYLKPYGRRLPCDAHRFRRQRGI